MVSVVRCWKAEYQKCKHSILLYMHSMIPIICAAIFAGYYHISRWELATKISAYLEVLAVAFPFLIGIIVGLVVQIENQAGHYQLLLGTIPSRTATYIGKLGFLMICAFGATFLALGTFAALYRGASASLYLKAGILLLITMLPIYLIHLFVGLSFGKGASAPTRPAWYTDNPARAKAIDWFAPFPPKPRCMDLAARVSLGARKCSTS